MIFILYRQTVRCHLHSTATSFTYGADQEEHFIISDAPYEHQREMIFLKETNEHIAIWEGEKIEERAYEVTGIKRFTGCKISRKCYDDDALIYIHQY
jgi:hypothetical protein